MGGALRFVVSRVMQAWMVSAYPLGTFTVNIVGCLLIGFLSGVSSESHILTPQAKLFLTTGFCGGFTTFSTFMSENYSLLHEDYVFELSAYVVASLAVGFFAVVIGYHVGRMV